MSQENNELTNYSELSKMGRFGRNFANAWRNNKKALLPLTIAGGFVLGGVTLGLVALGPELGLPWAFAFTTKFWAIAVPSSVVGSALVTHLAFRSCMTCKEAYQEHKRMRAHEDGPDEQDRLLEEGRAELVVNGANPYRQLPPPLGAERELVEPGYQGGIQPVVVVDDQDDVAQARPLDVQQVDAVQQRPSRTQSAPTL